MWPVVLARSFRLTARHHDGDCQKPVGAPSYKQSLRLLISQGANDEESNDEESKMTQHALYVQLEAKPGKDHGERRAGHDGLVRDSDGAQDVWHLRRVRQRARP